ncbi:MAG: EAL domain-containing protein [Chloroflexi bacterium]|nr:EAL domain-containing protein [Chloroflexota bacterium]
MQLAPILKLIAGQWNTPTDLPRPLKLERRLILGRWLGIVVFAVGLASNPHPTEATFAAYVVLVLAFGYNLILARVLRHAAPAMVVALPTLVDGLLCAVMIPLLGGFESPFYAVMYSVVVAAGMRAGFAPGMLLAGAIALIDGSSRWLQGDELGAAFIIRTGVLFMTVILTSFLYEEAQKAESVLEERLHQSEGLNGALAHQAVHDLLTGLPNRILLHQRVEQSIVEAATGNGSVALLVIDLDRFKEVNDTFGHQYGDLLLQQIGPRLSDVLERGDTIARLGGDEFAVLLPGATGTRAERIARELLLALDRSFTISDVSVEVGGSIGIALIADEAADSDTLLRRADVAMYVAKRTGGGFVVYSPDQDEHSPDRLAMVGELKRAIESDELILQYQPKISLGTTRCIGVEALIRWQHALHGLIPPDQFIPLAEQTGLIKNLSHWVLNAALKQSRNWAAVGFDVPIAVNLSMRDLHDAELPERVAGLLRHWGVDPKQLAVEITEHGLMAEPARALQTITGLRLMGIRISIDDFGTGYSSLAYLKRLPVDELKIDRSFIRDLATDDDDLAIVRSTISLGHDLGLTIVAEGIEDAGTWDLLRRLGCDIAQGYFLGRPMSAQALVAKFGNSQISEAA